MDSIRKKHSIATSSASDEGFVHHQGVAHRIKRECKCDWHLSRSGYTRIILPPDWPPGPEKISTTAASARIEYFESESKMIAGVVKAAFSLSGLFHINTGELHKHKFSLSLYADNDAFFLAWETEEQLTQWADACGQILQILNIARPYPVPSLKHVIQGFIQKQKPGKKKPMPPWFGDARLCLTEAGTLIIVQKSLQNPEEVIDLSCLRFLQYDEKGKFTLNFGRFSPIGEVKVIVKLFDEAEASNFHDIIMSYPREQERSTEDRSSIARRQRRSGSSRNSVHRSSTNSSTATVTTRHRDSVNKTVSRSSSVRNSVASIHTSIPNNEEIDENGIGATSKRVNSTLSMSSLSMQFLPEEPNENYIQMDEAAAATNGHSSATRLCQCPSVAIRSSTRLARQESDMPAAYVVAASRVQDFLSGVDCQDNSISQRAYSVGSRPVGSGKSAPRESTKSVDQVDRFSSNPYLAPGALASASLGTSPATNPPSLSPSRSFSSAKPTASAGTPNSSSLASSSEIAPVEHEFDTFMEISFDRPRTASDASKYRSRAASFGSGGNSSSGGVRPRAGSHGMKNAQVRASQQALLKRIGSSGSTSGSIKGAADQCTSPVGSICSSRSYKTSNESLLSCQVQQQQQLCYQCGFHLPAQMSSERKPSISSETHEEIPSDYMMMGGPAPTPTPKIVRNVEPPPEEVPYDDYFMMTPAATPVKSTIEDCDPYALFQPTVKPRISAQSFEQTVAAVALSAKPPPSPSPSPVAQKCVDESDLRPVVEYAQLDLSSAEEGGGSGGSAGSEINTSEKPAAQKYSSIDFPKSRIS